MTAEQLSEEEAVTFGQRLDAFAVGLTVRERILLAAILRDAEEAQPPDIDDRTLGDIVVAIHRTYRSPPISLNPQPLPSVLSPSRSVRDEG